MEKQKSTPPTPPAKAARGADEPKLAFLGSRLKSLPLKEATIREKLAGLGRVAGAFDQSAAVSWTDQGEELVALYMRHADAVLGFPSFKAFLRRHWPHGITGAYDRMRFAKYATRAQVERYRYAKLLEAIRLVELLGLADIAALEAVDLRLPAEEGGGTVRLAHAETEQLAAARRLLKAPRFDDAPRSAGEELQATRTWVKALCQKTPEYAALEPTAFLEDGVVTVRVTARGAKAAAVAERFYGKLARRRR